VIRETRDADVEGARRLLYEVSPELPAGSAPAMRHWLASHPERARFRCLVAEEDGEVVGWAHAFIHWQTSVQGAAKGWVAVAEAHRRRGIGGRLAAAVEDHLERGGARRIETYAHDGSEGHAFAERRGYRVVRRESYSWIDPRTVDVGEFRALEAAKAAEGFRVGPLEELGDRPRDLHALDAATTEDVPAAFPEDDLRYEEWLEGTLGEPDLDWEGSRVVFTGERPVAFTLLNVDREARRAENDMTGTLAELRGRGLARLVKLSSLVWAAENGIEDVSTGNDASNAAMLAVNRRLGYRERAVRAWLVKEL
jgi:GNAT superfamily N-acetyltransferase